MTVAELRDILDSANPEDEVFVMDTSGHRGMINLVKIREACDTHESVVIQTEDPYYGRSPTEDELYYL